MSIRDNLVAKAFRTGVRADLAGREHRNALVHLTAAEKWTVRIAVAEAMVRWLRENEEEGGPEQYMDEALADARAHVAANMHLVREP